MLAIELGLMSETTAKALALTPRGKIFVDVWLNSDSKYFSSRLGYVNLLGKTMILIELDEYAFTHKEAIFFNDELVKDAVRYYTKF